DVYEVGVLDVIQQRPDVLSTMYSRIIHHQVIAWNHRAKSVPGSSTPLVSKKTINWKCTAAVVVAVLSSDIISGTCEHRNSHSTHLAIKCGNDGDVVRLCELIPLPLHPGDLERATIGCHTVCATKICEQCVTPLKGEMNNLWKHKTTHCSTVCA